MTGIFSYEFEIKGHVPKKVLDLFALTQAKLFGLRGYIQETSTDVFKVYIEGEKEVLDKAKQVILVTGDFIKYQAEAVFQGFKTLENYTCSTFEVKSLRQ